MGRLGELSPAASVAVGVIVGLCSTSIQSIGLTLQRKSHLLEDEKEDDDLRRPPYRRRRWQIGMLMFIIANLVGSTIQITTLPLPVLSTLQASGLVFNTICATLILGEPFTRWSFGGTALVASGAVLIALFGALPEPSHNLDQLLYLLARQQFILWMASTMVMVIAILVLATVLTRTRAHNTPRMRLWRGMSYGSISSILSAHSLLVAKSAVELLVRTIVDRVNQFNRWQSWMILLGLAVLAISQLYFLHRGLKLCSTSVLYPFVFCVYNIVAIIDGLIYFDQMSRLPPLHAGLIAIGAVILLAGVLALSWRLDDHSGAPPPDAHTLLTPGMGIVEDTTTDEEDSDSSPDSGDEEAALRNTERTPLLPNGRIMSPTKKDNTILRITKHQRQRLATMDHEDIRDDLQDEESTQPPRLSITTQPKRKKASTTLDARHRSGDNEISEDESHLLSIGASLKRTRTTETEFIVKEQDRKRKRRKWSSRYRSASMPQPKRVRARTLNGSEAIASPTGARLDSFHRARRGSLGGWLRSWWWGRKGNPKDDDDRVRKPPDLGHDGERFSQ